jgi:Na+/H+-dicarboxylate symporter
MKIWIKYLLGVTLGILMAIIIPFTSVTASNLLQFFTELSLRAGRYFLLPLLFFSMTVAVCEVRDSGKLMKTVIRIGLTGLSVTAILVVLGLASALIIKLPRIPISVEKVNQTLSLDIPQKLLSLFPYNGFGALTDGAFLLPLYVFAGFAGAGFASDRLKAKPAFTFFDSMSKISYLILSFFTDALAIGMIAISCTWTLTFLDVIKSGVYNSLILMLTIELLLVIGIILPLLLKLVCKELHPYKVLYASITSLLSAFFSGDSNFTLPANLRHAKESLGIRRRSNVITLPILSAFFRSGAAMTITISFVVILRSYSSLGISFSDVMWIAGYAFGISLLLGALPTGGPYIALTILCTLYGRGFEAGYLLLKPAAPIICAYAAAIDAACNMFCAYYIGSKQHMIEHKEVKYYI